MGLNVRSTASFAGLRSLRVLPRRAFLPAAHSPPARLRYAHCCCLCCCLYRCFLLPAAGCILITVAISHTIDFLLFPPLYCFLGFLLAFSPPFLVLAGTAACAGAPLRCARLAARVSHPGFTAGYALASFDLSRFGVCCNIPLHCTDYIATAIFCLPLTRCAHCARQLATFFAHRTAPADTRLPRAILLGTAITLSPHAARILPPRTALRWNSMRCFSLPPAADACRRGAALLLCCSGHCCCLSHPVSRLPVAFIRITAPATRVAC